MTLIVGLGNPGHKYKKTRHNVGFRVIDELEKEISNKDATLFKPQTFMNNSGRAVKKKIASLWLVSCGLKNLYVIHDDIDLPLGTIRVSKNISSGGHRGVQSIIDELSTQNFVRFRIGINHKTCNMKHKTAENFVLTKFSKEEEKIVKRVIKKIVETIEESLKTGIKKTTIKLF